MKKYLYFLSLLLFCFVLFHKPVEASTFSTSPTINEIYTEYNVDSSVYPYCIYTNYDINGYKWYNFEFFSKMPSLFNFNNQKYMGIVCSSNGDYKKYNVKYRISEDGSGYLDTNRVVSSSCTSSFMFNYEDVYYYARFKASNKYFPDSDFSNIKAVNFQLYDVVEKKIYKASELGMGIVEPPKISFSTSYSENYQSCDLTVAVENLEGDYTLEYSINTSDNFKKLIGNSLTIDNNCTVIVHAVDSNGDELVANSITISNLDDALSKIYFNVDFSNPDNVNKNGICLFEPHLYNNAWETFDIYCSLESEYELYFVDEEILKSIYDKIHKIDWFIVQPNHGYGLHYYGLHESDVVLKFKLVNKVTGVTALSRTFKLKMNVASKTSFISSETNGNNDIGFDSGASNSGNPMLDNGLNVDFNKDNAVNVIKSFFTSCVSFLNLVVTFISVLPSWITVPIYTLFWILIFLFVIKFIKG